MLPRCTKSLMDRDLTDVDHALDNIAASPQHQGDRIDKLLGKKNRGLWRYTFGPTAHEIGGGRYARALYAIGVQSSMLFIETTVFTEDVSSLLTDDSYKALQQALLFRPDAESVIPGSGGKRGGVRVIYYWIRDDDTIYFLTMYPKTRQDDLSPRQMKILSRIVQEELS